MASNKPPQATGDLKDRKGKAGETRASESIQRHQQLRESPARPKRDIPSASQKRWAAELQEGLEVLREAVPKIKAGALVHPETDAAKTIPRLPEGVEKLIDAAARPKVSKAERTRMLREALTVASMSMSEADYKGVLADVRMVFRGLWWEPEETKEKFPLENTSPGYEAPGISGAKDEGILNRPLSALLTSWGVPKQMHLEMAVKLERTAREDAKAALRPKWEQRGKYAELKDLSAPQFLKRVYADEIARDGSIKKATVRNTDPALMSIVEAYISGREARGRDMGDAKGLRFVTSNAGRPKRADLG